MKKLFVFILFFILYFLPFVFAFAQYGPYGPGGKPLTILIDKKIGKPTGETKGGLPMVEYVDNLTVSDYKFQPNQEIYFQLTVKNTSTVSLTDVTVKDYLPAYLEPIEGPGTYDSNSKTITISAGDFSPNQEKVYRLKMKIFPQERLPADKGLFCLVNKADASNNGVYDDDTAQFCIEKQVVAAQKIPSAGPELGILLLGGELTLLTVGIWIKRKTSNTDNI